MRDFSNSKMMLSFPTTRRHQANALNHLCLLPIIFLYRRQPEVQKDKSAVRELRCSVQHHFHAWLPSTTVDSRRRGKQNNLDHFFSRTRRLSWRDDWLGICTAPCEGHKLSALVHDVLKHRSQKISSAWCQKAGSFTDMRNSAQRLSRAFLKSSSKIDLKPFWSHLQVSL